MDKLFKEMREKYQKVLKMRDVPEEERDASNNAARMILNEMKRKLKEILCDPRLPMWLYDRLLGLLIVVLYDLGIIAYHLNNFTDALNYFDKVIILIPDKISKPTPNYVLLAVEARNAFGAQFVDKNPKISALMIDEADRIYYNYRKAFPKKNPYSHDDHFAETVTFSGNAQLKQAHSVTKFHLRQYSRPVHYYYKSLEHAYKTLTKMCTTEITDLSPRAEIAIILGEYFINERQFNYGRYLFAIAAYLIDKYEENTKDIVANMKAMELKDGMTEGGRKIKEDRYISMADDKGRKGFEIPLKENEILVEVEERKKADEVSLKDDEVLVELEEDSLDETDSSDDDSEDDSCYDVSAAKKNVKNTIGTWIEYEEPTIEEEIRGWRAFLSRAWVKYGLHLMKYASQSINEPRAEVKKDLPKFPKIPDLDVSKYESIVPDEYPKTTDEAGPIFLFTQYRIIEAKDYYSLFSYPHEHVALAQEHSLLIRYMMKFEHDEKVLKKYLKARIRILEPLSLHLNYKFYLPICRLLWFELGKCYYELLQFNSDTMSDKSGNTLNKTIERINHYCSTGMVHLHNYIDSFRKKNSKLPTPEKPEIEAKLAFAHFYLGRMYHAYITFDQEEANEYTLIAYSCFRYVVKHCEKDSTIMEALKYQYDLLNCMRVGSYKNKLLLVRNPEEP